MTRCGAGSLRWVLKQDHLVLPSDQIRSRKGSVPQHAVRRISHRRRYFTAKKFHARSAFHCRSDALPAPPSCKTKSSFFISEASSSAKRLHSQTDLRPSLPRSPKGMRSPRHTFRSNQIPQGICTATRRQAYFTSPAIFHARSVFHALQRISLSIGDPLLTVPDRQKRRRIAARRLFFCCRVSRCARDSSH